MKKIIYTRHDGGVSVIHPTGVIPIEQVFIKDVPVDAINPRIVDEKDIPSNRDNRESWADNGSKVIEDQVKIQNKISELAKKEAKKNTLYSKLGLSKEEQEILIADIIEG